MGTGIECLFFIFFKETICAPSVYQVNTCILGHFWVGLTLKEQVTFGAK